MKPMKIIVGITGASGSIYAKMLLQKLVSLEGQVTVCDVIFSGNARLVWKYELGDDPNSLNLPAHFRIFDPLDFFAPAASGSAGYGAMIICPCTMGTIGRLASGTSGDLITRAGDVMLKERRKLVLVPRETPYNLIHLSNMKLLTEAGAIVCPASPSFYSKPSGITELVMTVVDRVLVLAGLEVETYRWGG
jgi:4-hydroxy-3-polyprenylbenzoate decarboxylase